MESALSTLKLLPSSKDQVKLFASKLLSELEAGDINPLDLKLLFKSLEKVQENIKEKLDEASLKEAGKYPGKSFELKGMKVETSELGTKYIWDNVNDPKYVELKDAKKFADDNLKAREEFLKTLPIEGVEQLDPDTGEVYRIYRPGKSSTTGIKITLI
jgi:hypothetical protein